MFDNLDYVGSNRRLRRRISAASVSAKPRPAKIHHGHDRRSGLVDTMAIASAPPQAMLASHRKVSPQARESGTCPGRPQVGHFISAVSKPFLSMVDNGDYVQLAQ